MILKSISGEGFNGFSYDLPPVYSEKVSTWCAMAYWLCAVIHVPLALWVAIRAQGTQHVHQHFVQILSFICVPTGAKGEESWLREHKNNLIAP